MYKWASLKEQYINQFNKKQTMKDIYFQLLEFEKNYIDNFWFDKETIKVAAAAIWETINNKCYLDKDFEIQQEKIKNL